MEAVLFLESLELLAESDKNLQKLEDQMQVVDLNHWYLVSLNLDVIVVEVVAAVEQQHAAEDDAVLQDTVMEEDDLNLDLEGLQDKNLSAHRVHFV